jgi:hypothetical protein
VERAKSRIPLEHSRHDRLLIARFAGGDSYPTEVTAARALVEHEHLDDDVWQDEEAESPHQGKK